MSEGHTASKCQTFQGGVESNSKAREVKESKVFTGTYKHLAVPGA